jgi:hypothetical protein
MRHFSIGLTVVGLLAIGMAGAATEPREGRRLEPTSKWVLDYADERCSLLRNFGSGDDAVLMQMDSFGSWGNFRVTLSGKSVPRSNRPSGRGSFHFPGDRENREAQLLQGTLGKDNIPAVSLNMDFAPDPAPDAKQFEKMSPDEKARIDAALEIPHPEFERTINLIRVTFDRGTPIELRVGSMAEPLSAMRACVDDLYKSWSIDPVGQKSLSALAVPLPSTVRHVQNDYPNQQVLSGTSAYVPVRLMIDANGEATSCVVQSPSVDKEFKQAVCSNLQGKFKPARDRAGKPVPSMFHTSVVYLMG